MRVSAARSGRYYQVTVRIESLRQGSIFAAVHESAPGPKRQFAAVRRDACNGRISGRSGDAAGTERNYYF